MASISIHPKTFTQDSAEKRASGALAPTLLLRLEGAAVLAGSVAVYAHLHLSWLAFAVLFLAPDLFMLGYRFGPKIGAAVYNAGHTYLAPAALCAFGLFAGAPMLVGVGLIWFAHIGFDRLLGYGLKHDDAFGHTHLG